MKIGFIELLTVVLIVLKLLGKISLSWLLVFTPMLAVYTLLFGLIMTIGILKIFVGGK